MAFFDRTFITEGMRPLLTQVASARRELPANRDSTTNGFWWRQDAHLLAVYHLATRKAHLRVGGHPGALWSAPD